jgi:hypothetical protein
MDLHQRRLNYALLWFLAAFLLSAGNAAISRGDDNDLPPQARVIDPDIIFEEPALTSISPDGKWLAYLSKGCVYISSISQPKPIQVFEVPESWSQILAKSPYADTHGDPRALYKLIGSDGHRDLSKQVKRRVYDLRWLFDSSAITFCLQSYAENPSFPSCETWRISTDGEATSLSRTPAGGGTISICGGVLTRDQKFLVQQAQDRARIWDIATNKPRAAPFITLVPSSTSDRWIGIEKDTMQLVLTDANFAVTKRFDEYRPGKSYGFSLDWSPDERFIIWRNQIGFDHFSNWEGFWMDLDTGAKRPLDGRYMNDEFGFTSNGGEFWRLCTISGRTNGYDFAVGAFLAIVPGNPTSEPKDVWRFEVDSNGKKPGAFTNVPTGMPLRHSRDCTLFALGLPRPVGARSGFFWHLLDRDGHKWKFPGTDTDDYISPYDIVGFAEDGKSIVAYDKTRLFIMPVTSIKQAAQHVD